MNNNFTPFPNLQTERLELRQVSMKDDKEIFFQRSDKGMNKYVHNPLCQSIEEARAWIEKVTNALANNESIYWSVYLKGKEQMIGGFCFWNLDMEQDKAEIGFTILPQHQGKGLMSEVLAATLQFGFDVMGLKRIEGYTDPENIASIRVMEKNGFTLCNVQPPDAAPYSVYELLKE